MSNRELGDTASNDGEGLLAALLAGPPASMLELALRWIALDSEVACRIAALACANSRTSLDLTARRLEGTPAGDMAGEFLGWLRGSPGGIEATALRILTLDIACSRADPGTGIKEVLRAATWLYAWFTAGRPRRRIGGAR